MTAVSLYTDLTAATPAPNTPQIMNVIWERDDVQALAMPLEMRSPGTLRKLLTSGRRTPSAEGLVACVGCTAWLTDQMRSVVVNETIDVAFCRACRHAFGLPWAALVLRSPHLIPEQMRPAVFRAAAKAGAMALVPSDFRRQTRAELRSATVATTSPPIAAFQLFDSVPPMATPFRSRLTTFHTTVGDLYAWNLIIVAGPPGSAKSSMGNALVHDALRQGREVLAIAGDTGREQYIERFAEQELGADLDALLRRDPAERQRVKAMLLAMPNLRVTDDVTNVLATLRAFHKASPASGEVVIIDQIQDLPEARDPTSFDRMMNELRRVAVECGYVCILISRTTKRSQSSTRGQGLGAIWGGATSFKAEVVVTMQRRTEEETGVLLEMKVEKLRHGLGVGSSLWFRVEAPNGSLSETAPPLSDRQVKSKMQKEDITERVLSVVVGAGALGATTESVTRAVRGRDGAVRAALRALSAAGRLAKVRSERRDERGRSYRPWVWVAVSSETPAVGPASAPVASGTTT